MAEQAGSAAEYPRQEYIYEMLGELAPMAREEGLTDLAVVLESVVRWRQAPLSLETNRP